MYNTTTLEVQDMDITAPERDIYHGVYPDFQLPLPNRPCISDSFCMEYLTGVRHKLSCEYLTYP